MTGAMAALPPAPATPRLPAEAVSADFASWARMALPGERIVYHEGDLANDRVRRARMTDAQADAATRLRAIGDLAASLQGQGVLRLAQQRVGEGRWRYIAEKRANAG